MTPLDPAALEHRIVELVNQHRGSAGMQPLIVEPRLAQVARDHALDMARRGYFDHVSPEGRSPFDRMAALGYQARVSAENISAGRTTPEDVVAGWMSSPGHRGHIMFPDYTQTGVGYAAAQDAFGHYWTQTFGC